MAQSQDNHLYNQKAHRTQSIHFLIHSFISYFNAPKLNQHVYPFSAFRVCVYCVCKSVRCLMIMISFYLIFFHSFLLFFLFSFGEIAKYLSESVTFSRAFRFSEWFSYGLQFNRIVLNRMESNWVSMPSMRIKPCKWLLLYCRFSSLFLLTNRESKREDGEETQASYNG